jgi:hypothetical protein
MQFCVFTSSIAAGGFARVDVRIALGIILKQDSVSMARSLKTPITVRIDPLLLEQVRLNAERDNRSVTNYIETALRQLLAKTSTEHRRRSRQPRATNNSRT